MTIDTGLSTTSTNPVQNRVVTRELGTRAPLTELTALSTRVSELNLAVTNETQQRTQQYNQLLGSLQSYIDSAIAQADWMTASQIRTYADDKLTELVSVHNVSTSAHGDLRKLIEDSVTLATFESHTDGGYNPVTKLNDALHVTLYDKVNWNAAADAIDDHLDTASVNTIHITQEEREKWTGASREVTDHTSNPAIHVTESDKETWSNAASGYSSHAADVAHGYNRPHVTYADRVAWDGMVESLTRHVADTVLASSLHLRDGERAAWNAAKTTLENHVAAAGIHITDGERYAWDEAAASIATHVAVVAGNPHGTTASDVGAYTKSEANSKVAASKTEMVEEAETSMRSLMAGGVRYKGSVTTYTELLSISEYSAGDAYIVTGDETFSYIDIDGTVRYQSCVYICQVAQSGAAEWIPFSEPFKVNLNLFDTKESARTRIDNAITEHDEDANAHSTVFAAARDAMTHRMDAIEQRIATLDESTVPMSDFEQHRDNTDNPHAVTAEQVGTLTDDQIEALVDGAQATAIAYAENKIGSIAASTFKWRGSFSFPEAGSDTEDPLIALSKSKDGDGNYTAWRRGTAVSDGDSPAYGDCYTETGSGRMYVFTGIPVGTDLDTETLPSSNTDRDGYARFGWDDVGNILDSATIIANAIAQARALIEMHNVDENAHQSIQNAVAEYNNPISVGGESFANVIDALVAVIGRYQAIGTVRQTASLVELVNRLYDQYTNKQSRIIEGLGIKLTNYDAEGNELPAVAVEGVATTSIAWDPSDMIGTGLAYEDHILRCTYETKAMTTIDAEGNEIVKRYVTLGESYASLDWVSSYVAGLMTKAAVDEALAKKQDKLTAGAGIAIFSVMDTSHNGIKVDEAGNPVFKREPVLDENGYPTYDEDGNQIYAYVQKRDETGALVFDQNGDPVYEEEEDDTVVIADQTHLEISTVAEDEQVLELTKLQLQDHVTGKWYDIRIDEDGDLTSAEVG